MTDLAEPDFNTAWFIFDDGSAGSVRFEEGTDPVMWAPGRFVGEPEYLAALEDMKSTNGEYVAGQVSAEQAVAGEDFDEMIANGVPERVARRLSGYEGRGGGSRMYEALRPTVGRAVHYVSHGTPFRPDGTQAFVATCRSAEVTEVNAEEPLQVGLLVKNPTGLFFHPLTEGGCFQSEAPDGRTCSLPPGERHCGTWHWPERV